MKLVATLFAAAVFAAGAHAAAQSPPDAPAYYVIFQDVHDEARFQAYVDAVTPEITRRGGVLVAAGTPDFTEGALPYRRLVVFRYPSRSVLERFIRSDDYARIRAIRKGAVGWSSAIVPGVEPEEAR